MIRLNRGIAIDERELDFEFIRSSGPGGQNVNKVSTAVRLRFDARGSSSLPGGRARALDPPGRQTSRRRRVPDDPRADGGAPRSRTAATRSSGFVELLERAVERPTPRRRDPADGRRRASGGSSPSAAAARPKQARRTRRRQAMTDQERIIHEKYLHGRDRRSDHQGLRLHQRRRPSTSCGSRGLEETIREPGYDPKHPVGSKFKQKIREGKKIEVYDGEVTAYERPKHLGARVYNKAFSVQVDYRLTHVKKATHLEFISEVTFHNLAFKMIAGLSAFDHASDYRKADEDA